MEFPNLKCILVQTSLIWNDIDANLSQLEEKLSSIDSHPDIILLPEMFTTGFNFDESTSEIIGGKTTKWLILMAKRTNALLIGSIKCKEAGNLYNRALAVNPEGQVFHYDKKHLFQLSEEKNLFTAGNNHKIIEFRGWKISLYICYDLRFPTWCRNKHLTYDLAVFLANWPKSRIRAWKSLLPARAIENQAYVAGVNIVGTGGMGEKYNGHSQAFQFDGTPLNSDSELEELIEINFSKKELDKFREKFPFHLDAD